MYRLSLKIRYKSFKQEEANPKYGSNQPDSILSQHLENTALQII